MVIGKAPFELETTTDDLFLKIINGYFEIENKKIDIDLIKDFDYNVISKECKDLIIKLLEVDYRKRLGFNGVNEIKSHLFFKVNNIDFNNIININYEKDVKYIKRPFVPRVIFQENTKYFDKMFTEMSISNDFKNINNTDNSIMSSKDITINNNCIEFNFSPFVKKINNNIDKEINEINNKKSRNCINIKDNCNNKSFKLESSINNTTTNFNSQMSFDK